MGEERPLYIASDSIGATVNENGNVGVRLGKPHPTLGFAEDLVLAVELSPTEARQIAALLIRKADEAEAGSSQRQ